MTDRQTTSERRAAKDALFEGFATIGRALGSGRRAEIIELLAQSERTVEDVADAIDQSVANTSHHLRTLARAGLVRTRREGAHVHYRLAGDRVYDLWSALRDVAQQHLQGIDELVRAYVGDRDELEAVDADELRHRLERGEVTLIDVRPEVEYEAAHIDGAESAPLEHLTELIDELPRDREVVAYCRGPYCAYADEAVRILQTHGYQARRLLEGVREWERTGRPVGSEGQTSDDSG